MSQEVAKKLNLSGTPQTLCLRWTDGTVRQDPDSKAVSVKMSGVNEKKVFLLKNVRTVPALE
jgi:hypothetical protein